MNSTNIGDAFIVLACVIALIGYCYSWYSDYKDRKLKSKTSANKGDDTTEWKPTPQCMPGFERVYEEGIVFDYKINTDLHINGTVGIKILIRHFMPLKSEDKTANRCVDRLMNTDGFIQAVNQLTGSFVKTTLPPPNYSQDMEWLIETSVTNRGFVYPNIWDNLIADGDDTTRRVDHISCGHWYLFDKPAFIESTYNQLLLAPGGVFNLSVGEAVQHFHYLVEIEFDSNTVNGDSSPRTITQYYSLSNGYKRDFSLAVSMPSMTKEVLCAILDKDMTNIPYRGAVFHDQGYLSIEVDLEDKIYLFSTVEGYRMSWDQSIRRFADAVPSALLATLIDARKHHSPALVKTHYGYDFDHLGISVHWYV